MEKTFKTYDRLLLFAGIRIFSDRKWNSKLWLLIQIICFLSAFFALIFTTGFVIQNAKDSTVLFRAASIWSTCVILSISLAICLSFRNNFRNYLIEMAFEDFMLKMPFIKLVVTADVGGEKMGELKTFVLASHEKFLKFTVLLLKTYVFCVFITATLYLCDPLYRIATRKDVSERIFAYDMWFPWSNEDYRVYVTTFIYHLHPGYLCCVAYPGLHTTIVLLIGHVIRQMKILNFVILNLDELIKELVGDNEGIWQSQCTAVLSQCIAHYVKLKSFNDRINKIFRPFYLALILDASVLICMCSVQVALSDFAWYMLKFYLHGISFIIVVFIFCFLGQQLENACDHLEAVVCEKWYIFDAKHKVHIRIFQMALRQGMTIHIFGTIPLSLPTFTWFLRTGMSFFTLIMSVFED